MHWYSLTQHMVSHIYQLIWPKKNINTCKQPPSCADFKKFPDKTDKNSRAEDFNAFKLSAAACGV